MHISRTEVEAVSLDHLYPASPEEFFGPKQHYKLLALLAKKLGPEAHIIDIGTHQGDSARAFSSSGNFVTSFDVDARVQGSMPSNVKCVIADLWDPLSWVQWRDHVLSSSLIFIDIDPHEGTRELDLVRLLRTNGYAGIIVLDDIWFFKPMRDNCWHRIESYYKVDATLLGHWSGTGIVSFDERISVDQEEDTSNWTLVTGYFDLTNKVDANDAIRARPQRHYINEHGTSVLATDQNLIVFCDQGLEEKIWNLRPRWLHGKTRVVAMSFEEFSTTQYLEKIIENRGGQGACGRDPRNTASYYLFCMARYGMLQRAIDANPFRSTHFAWINICIERMGFNNLIHLPGALAANRSEFSTCWIDYVSRETTEDLAGYFGPNGCRECRAACTMCSGFFTGRADFMSEVCRLLIQEFERCVQLGYGHADEQLFPIVYYKHPELFRWYLGDYAEMITNYEYVRERPEQPLRNLIRNSRAAGDTETCDKACALLEVSLDLGHCALSPSDLEMFERIRGPANGAADGVRPLPFLPQNAEATAYVCTQPAEGVAQLSVLKRLGCLPRHRVLEIGCGALVAGYPIVQYLEAGRYRGIDPNGWLASQSLGANEVCAEFRDKEAVLYGTENFRTPGNEKFDFILSHSILSHASDRQLTEFLIAIRDQLTDDGVCAASIRLAEGNEFGSPGSEVHGAHFQEWVYPGVSWFRAEDVVIRAKKLGLRAHVDPELTRLITSEGNPKAVHDWIVLRKTKTLFVTAFFRLDDRPVDEAAQFAHFERLADSGVPIVLFLDRRLPCGDYLRRENVTVITANLEWLLGLVTPSASFSLPLNGTEGKDTEQFLLLQNAKLQLLEEAQLQFDATHYAWIDFAIMKISARHAEFTERLRRLSNNPRSGNSTPGCWEASEGDLSQNAVSWRFCGGLIVIAAENVAPIASKNRRLLARSNVLTWEVNNWAKLERDGVDFGWYKADHDDSILGENK